MGDAIPEQLGVGYSSLTLHAMTLGGRVDSK